MKLFITNARKLDLTCFVFVLFTFFLQQKVEAQSIPINATVISNQNEVDFSANAIDGDLSTKAEVRASTGVLLGIGAYSGFLELEFPTILPANTTSYVKIDTDDNLLPSLLGGSLGGVLSNVTGSVLIGNQEFTVQAKNGSTVVLEGSSQIANNFASNNLQIVTNAQNEYFIALTPTLPYNRIRLTNRVGSLLGLGNVKRLGVYGAFYVNEPDVCGSASYTSFDGSGLNLDLLGLGGAGVANPHHVIDSDPNNFSRLSLGVIAVAGSINQTVYFDGLSEASDQFLIRLKVDPSLLALGVANNIQIIGYNNLTVVQTTNLNSLLNLDLLTLLQGNQVAIIPFAPNAPVNRVKVLYNSLLNVQLTQSIDLYDIKRVPPPPTISDAFTLSPLVCSGSTASLVTETIADTVINWYTQPVGGIPVATTNSGQPFVTGVLTENTTFYVAAKRSTCPEESLRIRIDVDVTDVPVASDIIIASNVDACNGFVVLSPSSTIGGAVFRYYKDPMKTQEITTGYAGDLGVTYAVNSTTGQLTISGLTAIGSPYNYYISLTVDGCENEVNTLKQVTVTYSSGLTLTVSSAIQGCGSVNLVDAILNFDTSSDIQYQFFDSLNNPIALDVATNITSTGTYLIQSLSLLGGCSSLVLQVNVTVHPIPTLVIPNSNLVVNLGDSATLIATSDSPITWYDSDGIALPSNIAGPFSTTGTYTFTAVANNGFCTAIGTIFVTVVDTAACPTITQRVYADTQSWSSILTGGVFDTNNAIDNDPKTFSTIVTGIGLLGIGTTWQSLQWDATVSAGTPLNVKLGSQYSGLIVAGAYSIVATKRNASGVPIDIGSIQPVSVSLLNLLPGENSFEFTFVPSDNTGPKDYDGVRIIVGSIASVAQNIKVYEAYYDATITQPDCTLGDVEDVFSGAVDLGVGVATVTVGVDNPYDAVDASLTSYATMYSGAGVLAAANLTVSFSTPTLIGESIQIVMSRPSTILDLNLLTGFSIQMYLGNTPVGSVLENTSSLLSLSLLGGGSEAMVTIAPQTMVYDRIQIRFGGVAGVLDFLRIHDINRIANTDVVDADATNTIEICAGDTIQLEVVPQDCVNFIWYDAEVGGTIVSTGTSFTIPSTLAPGTYDFYIQPVRYGCETFSRGKVTVIVGLTTPSNAITQVQINGGSVTNICSSTGTISLSAQLNSTITLTNPIFYWYSFDGTAQQLIAGESISSLIITGLAPGTYTYFVGVSSDEYCPTAQGDRTQVTFTILPFSQPSDIVADDVLICAAIDAVVTPTSSLLNPQFFWFFTNDATQPIISGSTVGGITYTIASNGTLTVSGLTIAGGPYTYYVGLTSDVSCLNLAGNFEPVVISVGVGTTPTTTDTTQTFCSSANPTIADIQVNEPNVTWYNSQTSTTALALTDALVNGTIYYGSITDAFGCVSSIRLEVTVTISNGTTPTTTSTTQTFCSSANPTIADIQVNEPNVTWYNSQTSTTALASTTALVNGTIYYGSITDAFGCVSSIRLEVTVTISNGTTPTTTSTTQTFCSSANPTIADIQVNEPNVTWYNSQTSTTALASTTALVNGTIYYGSITDAFGCVSSIRLEVTVTISNGTTPTTTSTTQTFCSSANPTIADIQVNEPNVTWYNSQTSTTALASTTALVNGTIYYGSITDAFGCVSSIRLEVTVTISNGTTPTTTDTTQTFCQSANPTIADIQVNEPNVTWYNSQTSTTALASTTALVNGTIYYGSITDAFGCVSSIRLEVTVSISNGTTPTTTDTTQTFCQSANPTIADIQVNEPNVTWYNSQTSTTALASTTALVNGTIYYGSITDAFGCVSSIRLEVTVTISNGTTPTTTDTTQTFCQSANPTIADIQVNEPNVTWYNSQTSTTALASTTALVNGTIYYGSITDAFGCVSSIRLEVTVTISNGTTPTTTDTTQTFCQSANPTIADIQVNEPNVTWYNSQTSTTALASTTALVNGTIYYGSITDAFGCVSSIRLEVTVTISNGTTPTTTSTTQTFCQSANPTIADIQVNEPNVTWYNSQTSTTALASTTALVNGTIYYGSITDAFGCVSSIRLEVTVTISNGTTPTTTDTTQTFCSSANPTIADIQVNEPNVTWYNSQTSTTVLASTDALVNGTIYYGSITDAFGCVSSIRLEVTIDFIDEAAATIMGGSSEECTLSEVTYTTTTGMTNYVWTITNGTITSGGLTTDDFVTVSWASIGASSVSVTFDNNCSVPSSATFNLDVIVCSDLTITKTVDNPTPLIDDNVTFTITVNNVGSSQLSDVVVNDLLQSGYQFVSATPSVGTYNNLSGVWNIPVINANESVTLIVVAKVLSTGDYTNTATIITSNPTDSDITNNEAEIFTEPICLLVYNEFSPNNDGANDVFNIDCIERYPNNKLEVFNRYGVLVYTRNKYLNDWDGTANVSGTVNKDDKLPTGTYYYILDVGENEIKKNGWLSIVR